MTTMIAEVYDALIAAGAPEDKARKAAETLAAYVGNVRSIWASIWRACAARAAS